VVVAALTLFAVLTPIDFTGLCGVLFVGSIILLVLGILSILFPSRTISFIYAGFGALLFTVYIVYDTQQIVGGRREEISPEEYIFAALTLYVDIAMLFLMILKLLGLMGGDDE
jgi:FtsH-binding integral membrane protein